MRRSGRGRLGRIEIPGKTYSLRSNKLDTTDIPAHADQLHSMASGFKSRDDPEYINYIEDQLLEAKAAREKDSNMLQSIVARMDKLDERHSASPILGRGRGIFKTPLKSTVPTVGGLQTGALFTDDLHDHQSSAADLVNGPLTQVLKQLSIAIDPTPQSSTKGLLLRPEYYIQHVDKGVSVKSLDHTKLSFKELISGMGRVMIHLSTTGGDLTSYVRHFNFVARQAASHNFSDAAFVGYDRFIVDQVIQGPLNPDQPPPTFVAGDPLGVASHFHAGNMMAARPQFPRGRGRGFNRRFRGGYYGDSFKDNDKDKDFQHSTQSAVPDGFPEEICFNFNYKACTGKCSKSHVCRVCRGNHKAPTCPNNKK